VAQIGDAIDQMDRATQQNSALVEERAAAAESLKVQAQQLVSAVAVFKLTEYLKGHSTLRHQIQRGCGQCTPTTVLCCLAETRQSNPSA